VLLDNQADRTLIQSQLNVWRTRLTYNIVSSFGEVRAIGFEVVFNKETDRVIRYSNLNFVFIFMFPSILERLF